MRQERSETTRKHILEAAIACFAEQGYAGTSTATIAKRAGVSQGIIFHHFATKDGLFSAVVRDGIDDLKSYLTPVGESQVGAAEKLQLLLRSMGEMTLANPALSEIVIRQLFQLQLDPKQVEDFGITEVIGAIREIFEEGKRAGAFGDIDTQTAAISLLGVYLAVYFAWLALGRPYDLIQALEQGCRMFLEGVVRR